MIKKVLLFTVLCFMIPGIALGQVSSEIPRRPPPTISVKPPSSWFDPADELQIGRMRRQASVENAARIPKPVKRKYEQFLKTPNSGIAMLFPAESTRVVNVDNIKGKILPQECSFYSFTTRRHQREFADLRFIGGKLRTASVTDSYGTLEPLGDVSPEQIDAKQPEVLSILRPQLPKKRKLVNQMLETAIREVEIEPGKSYLLRTAHSGYYDQLIAFQIVEAGMDGSVTIIWRRIHKQDSPKFKD